MSKNNHLIEQEEIMAYLDGELTTDRAAATVTHLEQCDECQTLAFDLRDVSQILKAWEVESSDPLITQSITAALGEHKQRPEKPSAVSGRKWRDVIGARRLRPVWIVGLIVVSLVLILIPRAVRNSDTTFRSVAHSIDGNSADHGSAGKPEFSQQQQAQDTTEFMRHQQLKQSSGDSVDVNGSVARGPMIIRTAALALTTKNFDKARVGLEEILKRHQGYVGEMNVNAPVGAERTLSATLRVPADQLEATIAELRGLGRVETESQSGQEVTAQYVDLEARLANAKNTELRLTDLLRQRTGKLADVLAVEVEIGRVRGEIERMEAERKNLAKQVAYATVNAMVTEDYKAQIQIVPPSTVTRFRNAIVEGYKTMLDSVVSVLVFLLSSGPSLLLWSGLLFFPVRGLWRRLRRTPM